MFVLDMGEPVKIVDLAKRMIHLSGFEVKDEHNLQGDIEIQYTGLRPGEKLYEELLIGENVSGTEHSRIMRAEEKFMDWSQTETLLLDLEDACQYHQCERVKKILLEAPTDYVSNEDMVDELCLHRRKSSVSKKT